MAFEKVVKSAVGARGLHYEIRMGSQLQSAKQLHRSIYFAITRSVIDDVGWEVAAQDDTSRDVCFIDMHEGTGTDAGFLLMMQASDSKGYSLGTTKLKNHTFSMGLATSRIRHYVLNELPVDPAPVEFTVDKNEKSILIQCPDWLRYNPLAAPKEESPPPQVLPRQTLELVKGKPEKSDELVLNRQERRTLAKKVASSLGKR